MTVSIGNIPVFGQGFVRGRSNIAFMGIPESQPEHGMDSHTSNDGLEYGHIIP